MSIWSEDWDTSILDTASDMMNALIQAKLSSKTLLVIPRW